MYKIVFTALFTTSILFLNAQINAITETGEKVVLSEDGTWRYADGVVPVKEEIIVNPKKFKKSKEASFLVKSTKTDAGVYLNPQDWNFGKATNNPEAEYEFSKKDGSIYGMLISEVIEIPTESLVNIAIENARMASDKLKVVAQEKRTVNGIPVIFMHLEAETQGIKFFYYGYYFSTDKGSNQLVMYSGQNMFEAVQQDCENFLNGIVKVKE